ncbi:hypothetical protein SAMN04488577_3799 [Bacillus sp. cl95]|nr:hypothetical protein SAMN02799634_10617 [Bacillus sp. UNCCL13]SFQ90499.1 hypothetical protein SAMN04488577_3799 [Bacillus sp. cl95]
MKLLYYVLEDRIETRIVQVDNAQEVLKVLLGENTN